MAPAARRALILTLAGASFLPASLALAAEPISTASKALPRALTVLQTMPEACRDRVVGSFRQGQLLDSGCDEWVEKGGRALLRQNGRGTAFGVVERKAVDAAGVRLVVAKANGCRRWPLRRARRTTLDQATANSAGCRVSRYRGKVTLSVRNRGGVAVSMLIRTDVDGRADASFAEIDEWLEEHEGRSLDSFDVLELGVGGWAGSIDLGRVRKLTADLHLGWVVRGWGVPALFAKRHPTHAGESDARALAVESQLARQEHDYRAVARGEMSARAFLSRHVWSPFRISVGEMGGAWMSGPQAPEPAPREMPEEPENASKTVNSEE
jgi:hypothetical protein